MIQRIQTVYLLLAGIVLGVSAVMECGTLWVSVIMAILAVISLADIFLWKQRPTQALVCLVPMAVVIGYYVMLAVRQPLLTWYMALPLVAVLLLFLARKAILKDEKLVRSLDRIR
ncbi:MAG: DUF4293 family protein [Prevotella sp.]|nr:DUF4293 family protein [Prevotella sp.]